MQPFAAEHLAPLTGTGPWGPVHTATLRSTIAWLRSGEVCPGYEPWDSPTMLTCANGVFSPGKVRPRLRCHDYLPIHAAAKDRHHGSICGQLQFRLEERIRQNSAHNMRGLEFAHWGPGAGFDGRETSDTFLHHCHADHFRQINRPLWLRWLGAFREHLESGKWAARKLPVARDWHSMFYRIWLAWCDGDAPWAEKWLTDSADAFLAVPMHQHGEPLFHPLWPYALWRYCGEPAENWILEAAYNLSDSVWPLMLAAIEYWIDNDRTHLEQQSTKLAAWAHRCYREIGSPIDQYWPPQLSPAVQVPFFLAACAQAGVEPPAKLPAGGLPVHFHPTLGSIVDLIPDDGTLLSPSNCHFRIESYGGDAPQGAMTTLEKGGLRIHAPWFYRLSVETDVPFHVRLRAGERYYIGDCGLGTRGTIEGTGALALTVEPPAKPGWPRNHWLNRSWGGSQQVGMWAGKVEQVLLGVPGKPTRLELAGHPYGMAWIEPQADFIWRPA